MTKAGQLFHKPSHPFSGISPQAHVDPAAVLAANVAIAPFAYVAAGAHLGAGCVLYPHTYVGEGCVLGAGCVLHPGVVLMAGTQLGERVFVNGGAVLGGDGFGFTPAPTGNEKIPQRGFVHIEEDCELGSLVSIDRATFAETRVRRGTKLDSHVHLGHNVDVGEYSLLCGQVGIAGSTKVGKRFIAAGQSAVSQGLQVGDHVVLGPRAGLTHSQQEAGEFMGMPAVPSAHWRRQAIALKRLPELIKKVAKLEAQLAALQGKP